MTKLFTALLISLIPIAVAIIALAVFASTFGAIHCHERVNTCADWEVVVTLIMAIIYIILNLVMLFACDREPVGAQLAGLMLVLLLPVFSILICVIGLSGWTLLSSVLTGAATPTFFNPPMESHWKMALKIMAFYATPVAVVGSVSLVLFIVHCLVWLRKTISQHLIVSKKEQ